MVHLLGDEFLLDLLDSLEDIGLALSVAVGPNAEVDFVGTGVLHEGVLDSEDGVWGSHLDVEELVVVVGDGVDGEAEVTEPLHL